LIDQVEEDDMGRACSTDGVQKNAYGIEGKARRKEITRKTKK
jgi:hypothetical protein